MAKRNEPVSAINISKGGGRNQQRNHLHISLLNRKTQVLDYPSIKITGKYQGNSFSIIQGISNSIKILAVQFIGELKS